MCGVCLASSIPVDRETKTTANATNFHPPPIACTRSSVWFQW